MRYARGAHTYMQAENPYKGKFFKIKNRFLEKEILSIGTQLRALVRASWQLLLSVCLGKFSLSAGAGSLLRPLKKMTVVHY